MSRSGTLLLLSLTISYVSALWADLLPGPSSQADYLPWAAELKRWIASQGPVNYTLVNGSSAKEKRALMAYTEAQVMIHDLGLNNVSRFLCGLRERYGGIDSILLWPTYPNLGVDDRNQFDFIRDVPNLMELVAEIQSFDVLVSLPFNPWDGGTRPIGVPFPQAVAELGKEFSLDGIFGDTLESVGPEFVDASITVSHPLLFQPEGGGTSATLNISIWGWGYWFNSSSQYAGTGTYSYVPGVCKELVLDSSSHLVHVCDRWNTNKTVMIQDAWFHATGVEAWENIWGFANTLTQRDAEAIRRVSSMLRFLHPYVRGTFEPHFPAVSTEEGVFSSLFSTTSSAEQVITVINRSPSEKLINVMIDCELSWFDCYKGTPLLAHQTVAIEAGGFGCLLCSQASAELDAFLAKMQAMTKVPLMAFSSVWTPETQRMISVPQPSSPLPNFSGMIRIPGATYEFNVCGTEIEGGNRTGLGCQFPWEAEPNRCHQANLWVESFSIDEFPVTNADWFNFVNSSGYVPKEGHNYLRHWNHAGFVAPGDAKKPVVWVSLEDVSAYCRYFGKRLPHDWEWGYAAQGGVSGRLFPWDGDAWNSSCAPKPQFGRRMKSPDNVDAHPCGQSVFGVKDLVGNVWEMTDSFQDNSTRFVLLRGGSSYHPQGSRWYFPNPAMENPLTTHNKYLLMAPSLDRSGAIGFRCAAQ